MNKSNQKFKPLFTTHAFQITKSTAYILELEISFCQSCQEKHAYLETGYGERTKLKWNFKPLFKE